MPYCFPRSFIKFQGHTGQNITDFEPNWAFPDYRPVAAFKSLRFALFEMHNLKFVAFLSYVQYFTISMEILSCFAFANQYTCFIHTDYCLFVEIYSDILDSIT